MFFSEFSINFGSVGKSWVFLDVCSFLKYLAIPPGNFSTPFDSTKKKSNFVFIYKKHIERTFIIEGVGDASTHNLTKDKLTPS